MGMKLLLVREDVVDVVRAVPHSLATSVLAPSDVELELAQVVHLVIVVVRACKHFVCFKVVGGKLCFCHCLREFKLISVVKLT
jgi:uncharacterized membrane protein